MPRAALAGLILLWLLVPPARAAEPELYDLDEQTLVADVAAGLVAAIGGKRSLDGRTLGIRPTPLDLPVSPDLVARLHQDVAAALVQRLRQGGVSLRLVSGDDIRRESERLAREKPDQFEAEIGRLLAAADYDLVLDGRFHWIGDGVIQVHYRLVEPAAGAARYETLPVRFRVPRQGAQDEVLDLQTAVDLLAKRAVDKAGLTERLYFQPFGYADTGAPRELGDDLARRLASAIRTARAGVITGGSFLTDRLPALTGPVRSTGDDPLGPVGEFLGEQDAILLGGSFWPDGDRFELAIRLRSVAGDIHEDRVAVRASSLPDRQRRALSQGSGHSETVRLWREHLDGPHGLRLFSDRGAQPVYDIGQYLSFRISLDRDAHLACFGLDIATEEVGQLFPNPYHPEAHLKAGQLLLLPDSLKRPDGSGFRWPARGPAGANVVKCFATDREPLPTTAPPPAEVRQILDLFRQRKFGAVSEAGLSVTIREPLGEQEQ